MHTEKLGSPSGVHDGPSLCDAKIKTTRAGKKQSDKQFQVNIVYTSKNFS